MAEQVNSGNILNREDKVIKKLLGHDKADITNIQMIEGEEVLEHASKNTVLICVRKGKVVFDVEGVEHRLSNEDILMMEPRESHSLRAVEDVDLLVIQIKE